MNEICTSWLQEAMSQEPLLVDSNQGRGGIDRVEAVAVMGRDPDKTPLALWREKTGRSAPAQAVQQEGDRRFWASLMEAKIAANYRQRTGRWVRKVDQPLWHPTFPFMTAVLEWIVLDDPHIQALLCRYADAQAADLWDGGVPRAIQVEAQHLMVVADLWAVDVAVLPCDGHLQIHRLQRDDALIARLVVHEALFWELVLTDTPPIDPPRIAW